MSEQSSPYNLLQVKLEPEARQSGWLHKLSITEVIHKNYPSGKVRVISLAFV